MPKSGSRAKKTESTPTTTASRRSRKVSPAVAPVAAQVPAVAAEPDRLELDADLRIGAAAATHKAVLAAAAKGDVVVDGARVAKIDAAGVQALLAALTQISQSGGGWRWHNPSTTLVQGVAVLGLGESLRLP